MAKSTEQIYSNAAWTYEQLMKFGLPEPAASHGTYQIYHETDGYTNRGWNELRNASGLMFARQPGAKRSTNGYAYFDSWDNYYKAYVHELTKKSNPSGAKTLENFNERLKANGYYTADKNDYLTGLKRARFALKQMTVKRPEDIAKGVFRQLSDREQLDTNKIKWVGIAATIATLWVAKKILFK